MKIRYLLCVCWAVWGSVVPQWSMALELVTMEYPPYEYEENNTVKGLAVEVVQEAFRRIDQPISIQILPWARAIGLIEKGQADAIFTTYKNEEREKFADYSEQVLILQTMALFVVKESPIEFDGQLEKINQYEIGLVRQFSYGSHLDNALNQGVISKIDFSTTVEFNVAKLLKRRFDIMASDQYSAIHILNNLGKLHEVRRLTPHVQQVPSYLAFSKKRQLTSVKTLFDQALFQMKIDGTYQRIIQNFLQENGLNYFSLNPNDQQNSLQLKDDVSSP